MQQIKDIDLANRIIEEMVKTFQEDVYNPGYPASKILSYYKQLAEASSEKNIFITM